MSSQNHERPNKRKVDSTVIKSTVSSSKKKIKKLVIEVTKEVEEV